MAHSCLMINDWYEKLRCPACNKDGMAILFQDEGAVTPEVEFVPEGFKVIATPTGPDFQCRSCDVAVGPW